MTVLASVFDEGQECAEQRPAIPAFLKLALAAWLTCGTLYGAAGPALWGRSAEALALGACFAAAVSVALAVAYVRKGRRPLLALLGVSLGILMALAGAFGYAESLQRADGFRCIEIVLDQDVRTGPYGPYALGTAYSARGESVFIRVNLPDEANGLGRGARLSADALVDSRKGSVDSYTWSQGIAGSVDVRAYSLKGPAGLFGSVASLRMAAVAGMALTGGNQAGLMQALACGYTRTLEGEGAYEDWKTTGLAHLVAVSGSHLAIITALVSGLLLRLRAPASLRTLLSVAFVVCYLVFSGMAVSAVRSGIMAVASLMAYVARRRSSSLNAIGVCVLLFLAFDPKSCISASLILSAGSTLGIILFSRLMLSWFEGAPRASSVLVEPVTLTLTSSIATQPYSVSLFSQLPLISLIANVVTCPLFVPTCVASLVAAVFCALHSEGAQLVVSLAAILCAVMQAVVEFLADLPYACIAFVMDTPVALLLSLCAAYLLWHLWPRLSLRQLGLGVAAFMLALFAILVPLHAYDAGKTEIIALDVGQGDAFVLRSKGSALLIDTGNSDDLLKEALARNRVFHLDAVLITHGDDDHCGSLEALASVTEIDRVLLAEGVSGCSCDSCTALLDQSLRLRGNPSLEFVEAGDSIRCGDFALRVLWPSEFTAEGGNEDSVCLLASIEAEGQQEESWTALFTGDLESEQLREVVDACALGQVDVLKVGHHGSQGSLDAELMRAFSPSIALIGVGEGNDYGHPHDETISLLEGGGAVILRTDVHGDVALRFEGEEVVATTSRR